LVIRPKDPIALANALQAKLRIDFPAGVNQVSSTLAGVELVERTTADGVLHQFVVQLPKDASRDAITLVSNSRGALTRILEVVQGKRPSLGSEPDFEYMLRRDPAVPSDVLAYAGDRFVSTSVSPAQRILDARRQLALGELRRAGYAAMLFALMEGRQPTSVAELQKSPWLKQNLLSHSNKEPIKFELGAAPRSSWGTPAALTPLADLPALTHVSVQERDAYTKVTNRSGTIASIPSRAASASCARATSARFKVTFACFRSRTTATTKRCGRWRVRGRRARSPTCPASSSPWASATTRDCAANSRRRVAVSLVVA
jgi:hypothetical protein